MRPILYTAAGLFVFAVFHPFPAPVMSGVPVRFEGSAKYGAEVCEGQEVHEEGIDVELKLFPDGGHSIGRDYHYAAHYSAIVAYCLEHWPDD